MDKILVAVQAIASRQHGVISGEQMVEAGASRKWVSRRMATGVLIRVSPAVYRFGGVRPSFDNKAMAAVLSARGPGLISHRSAAYLHGIGQTGVIPGFVDLTVPRHRRPRSRPGLDVHESTAFDLAEPTIRNLIPVTGVARTILDCCAVVDDPIRLLDDAVRLQLTTWDDLWACYLAHKAQGRAGLSTFHAVVTERDGNVPPGSDFARRMARLLVSGGLPEPVFEWKVVVGRHVYYLDLAWPEYMVGVECNDLGSHLTGKGFRRDPMKRNRCELAGWAYYEYTWFDLVRDPAEVLGQVGRALRLAA
jgi:hypothetical protein